MPSTTRKTKSWQEKLDVKGLPKIVSIPPRMRKIHGTGTMLVPAPREVDELIRKIPKGKVATINHLRAVLAERHGATVTCPMTIGICTSIAAHASAEAAAAGRKCVAPYWRVVKEGGALNPRFPGGIDAQARRLESEGWDIQFGKSSAKVMRFEQRIASLA